MAHQLSIVANALGVPDVGMRLSAKLHTLGVLVTNADKTILSISKDVAHTSAVLKELGEIVAKDRPGSQIANTSAQETCDGVLKECNEVYKEMDGIMTHSFTNISSEGGITTAEASMLLERLRWPLLQPRLLLLRSNLNSLKTTLLLMLNILIIAWLIKDE